jgi:hypothetical protein
MFGAGDVRIENVPDAQLIEPTDAVVTKGRHGFGMSKHNLPSDSWIDLFKNWLDAHGFLSLAKK